MCEYVFAMAFHGAGAELFQSNGEIASILVTAISNRFTSSTSYALQESIKILILIDLTGDRRRYMYMHNKKTSLS